MGLLRTLGKKVVDRLREPAEPAPPRAAPPPRAPPPASRPSASPPPPASPALASAPAPQASSFPEEARPASLAELRAALGPGRRLRVVNHWATWCDPCVEEIPLLVALHLQLEDRADFLGISWERFDDDRPLPQLAERVADFASVRAVRFPSLLVTDPPERFFEALGIRWQKIPQTWVIAPDGSVLWRAEGALTEESGAELVRLIEGLAQS